MKRTFIYSAVVLLASALLFTSCKPSRVWANKKKEKKEYSEPEVYSRRTETPPPPPQPVRYTSYVYLIITPYPGFVMKQNPDGKFYHRTAQGFLYWKGYDNRFYLDSYHLGKVRYSQGEYEEWKRYRRASR